MASSALGLMGAGAMEGWGTPTDTLGHDTPVSRLGTSPSRVSVRLWGPYAQLAWEWSLPCPDSRAMAIGSLRTWRCGAGGSEARQSVRLALLLAGPWPFPSRALDPRRRRSWNSERDEGPGTDCANSSSRAHGSASELLGEASVWCLWPTSKAPG